MDKITYNGREYPVRRVFVPDFGDRNISVESLEDKLFDLDAGTYREYEEAKAIDEDIFFYVPDEEMALDDERLGCYVYAMIA